MLLLEIHENNSTRSNGNGNNISNKNDRRTRDKGKRSGSGSGSGSGNSNNTFKKCSGQNKGSVRTPAVFLAMKNTSGRIIFLIETMLILKISLARLEIMIRTENSSVSILDNIENNRIEKKTIFCPPCHDDSDNSDEGVDYSSDTAEEFNNIECSRVK